MDFALSAASELPSKRLLEEIAGSPAAAAALLQQLALDPNRTPGVRLRALASLPAYPSPALRDAMRDLLDGYAAQPALLPIEVWMVRGALEALATCGDADDVARMTTWLEWEASRDIRARAAWALGRLGQVGGLDALKKRFLRETVGQVSYQITAALDLLEQ
jgi:HEAT repeat protein